MDIEFHYYITYLIAARAGYPAGEAATLAHACQLVDDNTKVFEVRMLGRSTYRNLISQTFNILRPREEYTAIYETFHFLPGDPQARSARRADGITHPKVTTPDSPNARATMAAALATGDLYRIGVACHAYADTWAHQNFVGTCDPLNALPGAEAIPAIGHADARHRPDEPATVWEDARLAKGKTRVVNRDRFLAAARCLIARLRSARGPEEDPAPDATAANALKHDLEEAIGPETRRGRGQKSRLERYEALALTEPYGGAEIPHYEYTIWPSEAFLETVEPWNDLPNSPEMYRPGPGIYNWQDTKKCADTKWYRFQEAVRAHHRETLALLG